MEDYDLVLVREPVVFNYALFITLLLGSYVAVLFAMLLRVYLRVGQRRR